MQVHTYYEVEQIDDRDDFYDRFFLTPEADLAEELVWEDSNVDESFFLKD